MTKNPVFTVQVSGRITRFSFRLLAELSHSCGEFFQRWVHLSKNEYSWSKIYRSWIVEHSATQQMQTKSPLSLPIVVLASENLRVEHIQNPAGEGTCRFEDEHTMSISLASRPVPMLHRQGGKTYSGLYRKGDMAITPANMSLFARGESDDHYLQIRLTA